jgi:hypothetical protein
MGNTLGSILPMAMGFAISPVPMIAVIWMLFSKRARSNGPAYLFAGQSPEKTLTSWKAWLAANNATVMCVLLLVLGLLLVGQGLGNLMG